MAHSHAVLPGDAPAVSPDKTSLEAPRGRPSWSGLLRLSLLAVPVKAYPAHHSAAEISFHQLHASCGQRIRHPKHCPVHGAVAADAIVRGYEFSPDHYVVVEPEELDRLRPAKDKALTLEQLLPEHQVDPGLFAGRSLYLLADGIAARHPFAVLADALQRHRHWALGRVVFSCHRQLVLVRPVAGLLAVDVLRYPAQCRRPPLSEAGSLDAAVSRDERRLVDQLVDTVRSTVDWTSYRDSSAEELRALIDAKIAGRAVIAPEEPAALLPLVEALKQSVALVQQQTRPAGRAGKPRAGKSSV